MARRHREFAGTLGQAPHLRCTSEARPQLLGHDLDDGSGAAILDGPGPLLESAHDHDPAALRQRLSRVLGLSRQTITVKKEASWSLRPLAATRNMARAIPPRCSGPRVGR